MYFGSKDMQVGHQILENNRKKSDIIFFHEDISNMKDVPKQKDGINCGVYTLWYLVLQCFKDKENVELVADGFRD